MPGDPLRARWRRISATVARRGDLRRAQNPFDEEELCAELLAELWAELCAELSAELCAEDEDEELVLPELPPDAGAGAGAGAKPPP